MKAVYYETYGGTETLRYGTLPEPKLGRDSVMVNIKATSVNPVDWKIMAGYLDGIMYSIFPIIPGWDVAGVVEAVGSAVTEFAQGDEVFGYVRMDFVHGGSFAEKIAAPVRTLALKPSSLSWEQAAAIPLAGLTAYQGLKHALQIHSGDTVLISGGSGGVGTFAIQIAKALGARVIATASPNNHDFLRELGAEPASYGPDSLNELSQVSQGGVDAFFDLYGGDGLNDGLSLLKDKSRIASVADLKAKDTGGKYVFVRPSTNDLKALSNLVENRQLTPIIAEVFELKDAALAFDLSLKGHTRGKIVVQVC